MCVLEAAGKLGRIVFLAALLSGYAGPAGAGTPAAALDRVDSTPLDRDIKSLKVVPFDSTRHPVVRPALGDSVVASFRVIPGALAGRPSESHSMQIPVQFGGTLSLSLKDMARAVAPVAQPSSADSLANGVDVLPAETRFARVGTFFYDTGLKQDILGAGIVNAGTLQYVMLAYFDRACTVSGNVDFGEDKIISLSLIIPKAGMYWIRLDESDPRSWKIEMEDPDAPLWFVSSR